MTNPLSSWIALTALACLTACAPSAGPWADARVPSGTTSPRAASGQVVVYTSEGHLLHAHALDQQTGELSLTSTEALPEQIHYAVADARSRFLYVSASDGKARHGLYAFAIDARSGQLSPVGAPFVPPAGRIIQLSISPGGDHLVLAHNQTSSLSSVALGGDGSLGASVQQTGPATTGYFTHQAQLDGTGRQLIACALGAAETETTPEQPGSLTVFRDDGGVFTWRQTVLPGAGLGPRHLDYAKDRVYVVLERGNRLASFAYVQGVLATTPEFEVLTLIDPAQVRPRQRAGAIHVHPSGKYLYVSNRADQSTDGALAGKPGGVFVGGENNIALFSLDEPSGRPRLLAHYDTRGIEPRTFTLTPGGGFLIVGNQSTRNVLASDGALEAVPRSAAVFSIGTHGHLSYLRKYDFARGDVFWVGSVKLP